MEIFVDIKMENLEEKAVYFVINVENLHSVCLEIKTRNILNTVQKLHR
jgi:hypothetical protein